MTQRTTLHGTTAVFIALASMAQADVTASDVWANISNFYGAAGYEISTGSVNDTGDSVTVTDLKVSFPNPYADLQTEIAIDASATIPSVEMTSNGDGSVAMSFSESYPINLVVTPEGETPGNFGLLVNQAGLSVVASGDPDNVSYAISGPQIAIVLDKIEVPGEEELSDAFKAEITMSDFGGTYSVGAGATPALAMELASAAAGMSISVREPGGSGAFDANLDFTGLGWTNNGVYAQGDKPGDVTSMLRAGMMSKGEMTHSGSSYNVNFQDRSDAFAMEGTAASGGVTFDMSENGMSYSVGNTGMTLKVSGSEIPLPEITMSAAATLFGLTMPILASDAQQDVGLQMRLEGFETSDMIWGMIDPGNQLGRDPLTVIADLAGKASLFVDILDPIALAEMDVEMPGGIHALDIKEVKVMGVGAEANASGAFTFDMNNFSPAFGGMPAPTGALDVSVSGANGLMDKLVGMGLIGQEEVMGARMMLGLFARPGETPDSLVSKIEVDGATGAVSANGQRLQ